MATASTQKPSPWATDALWLGELLVQRLEALVPALQQVMAVDEVSPKVNALTRMPGAMVLLHDMRPVDSSGLDSVVRVDQDWLVVLQVQPARREGNRAVAVLGPLVSAVVANVHGWQPEARMSPFEWQPGPRPQYGATTLLPLLFRLPGMTARMT